MYPEASHLSVAVYHAGPEATTLARVCAAVESVGGVPGYEVTVIPAGRDFGFLFDVADVLHTTKVTQQRYARLLAGQDPEVRLVQARYEHPAAGMAIVGYQPRPRTDPGPHPVGVTMGAGVFGLPEFVWSAAEQRAARALAAQVTTLLEAVTRKSAALYGAIGVEEDLPVPVELTGGQATLPTPAFVSRQLLTQDPGLAGRLRQIFDAGAVTEWAHGWVVSAWAPFLPAGAVAADPERARERLAGALRRVVPDIEQLGR